MLSCTFFGHKDAPRRIANRLREVLLDLIIRQNVTVFYVGNQGSFDCMVRRELQVLKQEYTHIRCVVVLAYLPQENENTFDSIETLYPEGLELVPPKFAIDRRNKWMVSMADYVVTYVHRAGGALRYKEMAERRGKHVYNLADKNTEDITS